MRLTMFENLELCVFITTYFVCNSALWIAGSNQFERGAGAFNCFIVAILASGAVAFIQCIFWECLPDDWFKRPAKKNKLSDMSTEEVQKWLDENE